jgi:hypothetical protein
MINVMLMIKVKQAFKRFGRGDGGEGLAWRVDEVEGENENFDFHVQLETCVSYNEIVSHT